MSEDTTGPIGGASAGSGAGEDPNGGAPSGGENSGASSGGGDLSGSPTTFTRDDLVQRIPEELREQSVFQNLNQEDALSDLANQFVHAQKMIGQERMPAPQENWTDEQWDTFWSKAGRPETSDKYSTPEVEGAAWDEAKMTEFKDFAHKLGVPDKHFGPLMQKYAEEMKASQIEQSTELKETVDTQLTSLKNDLLKEGKDYDTTIQMANEALKDFGDESLVQLFTENPILANHPSIVKTFASLAESRRESLARNAGAGRLNSPTDAKAALQAFEEKNSELIYAEPEKLEWSQRQKRDRLLKERTDLYQMAFPEENA